MRSNDRWGYITGHNGTWLLISDTCFDPKIRHLSLQSPFCPRVKVWLSCPILHLTEQSGAFKIPDFFFLFFFFLVVSYLFCFVSAQVIYFFLFFPWVKCKPLILGDQHVAFLNFRNPVALSSRHSSSRIIKESIRPQPNPLTRRTINLLVWRWFS